MMTGELSKQVWRKVLEYYQLRAWVFKKKKSHTKLQRAHANPLFKNGKNMAQMHLCLKDGISQRHNQELKGN